MPNIVTRSAIPWIASALSLSLALLLSLPAAAQQRVRSGSLHLAGFRATCGAVETDVMHFNDIAASTGNLIILNPRLFRMPRAQQMFWYTHECGHQIFGPNEAVADCWSVQQGWRQGWLSLREFEQLAVMMSSLPGDAEHLSGPVRAAHMRQCYNTRAT